MLQIAVKLKVFFFTKTLSKEHPTGFVLNLDCVLHTYSLFLS